jgi:hypothetical protein
LNAEVAERDAEIAEDETTERTEDTERGVGGEK